jgi:hypothetical protein
MFSLNYYQHSNNNIPIILFQKETNWLAYYFDTLHKAGETVRWRSIEEDGKYVRYVTRFIQILSAYWRG